MIKLYLALTLPENPNLFLYLLQMNDDDVKCTIMPIVMEAQLPKDDVAWNVWPFLPLKVQLKHYYYPMLNSFDFEGDQFIKIQDLVNMREMLEWMKDRSGQPSAVQFFINKRKLVREEACLIYYNSGAFESVPNEKVFYDLPDEEYHQLGFQWWSLWANMPWEAPRIMSNDYVDISEPSPIRGDFNCQLRLSREENEFIAACHIPWEWANTSPVNPRSTPEIELNNAAVRDEWKILRKEKDEAAKELILPVLQEQMVRQPSLKEKVKVIQDAIDGLSLDTPDRISVNKKVMQYEKKLKKEAQAAVQKLQDFREEKLFYAINAKDNAKLLSECYLPQLHGILDKTKKKGQAVVEVKDQPTQYDSADNLRDWSGQWSSDEN